MMLTLLLVVVVVVVAPLAPAPTSAVPWPPAPNMAPGPNSAPGSPFWGGGGGGNAEKGGATNPSCAPVESWEPCSSSGEGGGEEGDNMKYAVSEPQTVASASWWRQTEGVKILLIKFHSLSLSFTAQLLPHSFSLPLPSTSISLTGMCFQSANHEIFTANTSIIKSQKIRYTVWDTNMLMGWMDT